MTTRQIAQIADARRMPKGWLACCPAHADKSPSLSISEGRDGRTLVRCFAGCELRAIANGLRLKTSDFFAEDRRLDRPVSRIVQRTAVDIERALQDELSSILKRESLRVGFSVAELARHRNEARAIVERSLSVQLKRERHGWWELDPYAVDPAWKMCLRQALRVGAAHSEFSFETFRKAIAGLPKLQHRVLLLARELQKELATSGACPR